MSLSVVMVSFLVNCEKSVMMEIRVAEMDVHVIVLENVFQNNQDVRQLYAVTEQ